MVTVRTKGLCQLLRLNRTAFLNIVQANVGDGTIIMNNFLQVCKFLTLIIVCYSLLSGRKSFGCLLSLMHVVDTVFERNRGSPDARNLGGHRAHAGSG